MSSIGSVTCTFVKGNLPTPKMRVEVWAVPGLDGFGAQELGLNDSAFSVKAILYAGDVTTTVGGATVTACGIDVWQRSLEALQGTIVTITNDLGIARANCLILKVGPMESVPVRAETDIKQRGEIQIEGVVLA